MGANAAGLFVRAQQPPAEHERLLRWNLICGESG